MKFPKLARLSIVHENTTGMQSWSYVGRPWWTSIQDLIVKTFEETTLEVITAALGVKPKLCRIRTSSLKVYQDSFYPDGFTIMSYSMVKGRWACASLDRASYVHDVEWFWQAEEGKTLVWDMEKAEDEAEKRGLKVRSQKNDQLSEDLAPDESMMEE